MLHEPKLSIFTKITRLLFVLYYIISRFQANEKSEFAPKTDQIIHFRRRGRKSTRSVPSRQGHRRKAEKFFALLFVLYKK